MPRVSWSAIDTQLEVLTRVCHLQLIVAVASLLVAGIVRTDCEDVYVTVTII